MFNEDSLWLSCSVLICIFDPSHCLIIVKCPIGILQENDDKKENKKEEKHIKCSHAKAKIQLCGFEFVSL